MKRNQWRMVGATAALSAFALGGAVPAMAQSNQGDTGGGGPVRLARFSYVSGNVSWRPDESVAWSTATINLPMKQGSQVWVTGGGRAEVQFDDGSVLRLGNGAVATLQTLYSDAQGEFTEVKLNEGTSSMHLKSKYSIYQIDTPFNSVKSEGPSRLRVDVGSDVEVAVRDGQATLTGNNGDTALRSGDYVDLNGAASPVNIAQMPNEDAWDQFDDNRDQRLSDTNRNLPSNIGLVAGDLDTYGGWHNDSQYGNVWVPRESADWRPYADGRWVWEDPFGWTWVSNEAWGWAPYHYGTWVHASYGWGWCPGPVNQYWSPAVVSFTNYGGNFCWTPLCPTEVHYPSYLSVGFASGNWAFNFSIGGCAVYQPVGYGYCSPYAFNNYVVNRSYYNPGFVNNYNNGYNHIQINRYNFVPHNAQYGAVTASSNGFNGMGRFQAINANATSYFKQGRSVVAGNRAFSGPVSVRPTLQSVTPSRTFVSSEQPKGLSRAMYRAPIAPSIARTSTNFGRTVTNTQLNGLRGQRPITQSSGNRYGRSQGVVASRTPGTSAGNSAVDRARQAVNYQPRTGSYAGSRYGSSAGSAAGQSSRSTQGGRYGSSNPGVGSRTTGAGRSASSGSSPSDAVARARQSLGYRGRSSQGGSANNSGYSRSTQGSASQSRSNGGSSRGSQTNSGRGGYTYVPRGSQSSSNNGGSSRYGSSNQNSGYSGRGYSGRGSSGSSSNSGYQPRGSQNSGYSGRGSSGYSGRGSSGSSGYGGYQSRGSQSSGNSGYSGRGSSGYSGGSSRGSSGYSGGGSRGGYSGGNSGGGSRGGYSGGGGGSRGGGGSSGGGGGSRGGGGNSRGR